MDVITKDANFKDQICEISLGQIIYFPEKHTNGIRAMISGPIKTEYPLREFITRTVEAPTQTKDITEKILSVRRIS